MYFWPIVIIVTSVLFLLCAREIALLAQLPRGYPDRGLYWFNTYTLFFGAATILTATLFLDARKATIEGILPPFPAARFAPARSVLDNGTIWIYETGDTTDAIRDYYQRIASSTGTKLVVDRGTKNMTHLLFVSGDRPIFLTIIDRGNMRELDYSFEGKLEATPAR